MIVLSALTALAVDVTLPVQARLVDALGAPVTGTRSITVLLCPNATPTVGESCYSQTFSSIDVTDGYVSVLLGSGGGLAHTVFDPPALYTAFVVDGTEIGPRQPVGSVRPRGGYTGTASVDGADPAAPTITGVLALHLKFDGNFADSSPQGHTVSAFGSAAVDGDARFGTGAVRFGSGGLGYLSIPAHASFAVGAAQDFTIDFWMKYATTPNSSGCQRVFQFGDNANDGYGLMHCDAGAPGLYFGVAGSAAVSTPMTPFYNTGWHHVAVTRASGTLRMFIDGIQVSSASSWTNTNNGSRPMYFSTYPGAVGANGYYMTGRLDDFRFLVGQALWTSGFAPPAPTRRTLTITNGMVTAIQ